MDQEQHMINPDPKSEEKVITSFLCASLSNLITLYFLGLSWIRKIKLQKMLIAATVFFNNQLCLEETENETV